MTIAELSCLTGATLAFACVILLDALRRRAARAEQALVSRIEDVERKLSEVATQVTTVDARTEEIRADAGLLVTPEPPRSGFNLNRRREALRRLRKGESTETIASALAVPTAEVEFLEKVQRILIESEKASAPAGAPPEVSPFASLLAAFDRGGNGGAPA